MARTVGIGHQDFETLILSKNFYIAKNISFANAKERDFQKAKQCISQILEDIDNKNIFLLEGDLLTGREKSYFQSVSRGMEETTFSDLNF